MNRREFIRAAPPGLDNVVVLGGGVELKEVGRV